MKSRFTIRESQNALFWKARPSHYCTTQVVNKFELQTRPIKDRGTGAALNGNDYASNLKQNQKLSTRLKIATFSRKIQTIVQPIQNNVDVMKHNQGLTFVKPCFEADRLIPVCQGQRETPASCWHLLPDSSLVQSCSSSCFHFTEIFLTTNTTHNFYLQLNLFNAQSIRMSVKRGTTKDVTGFVCHTLVL